MKKKVLEEYEVLLKNVIVCITDNARNMMTTVEELNLDKDAKEDNYTDDGEDDIKPSDLDLEEVCPPSCKYMQCAAHTLQLAVSVELKHNSIKGIVAKLRNVAKEAKTLNVVKSFKEGGQEGCHDQC